MAVLKATLRRPSVFLMADALGMQLMHYASDDAICGDQERDINLGGLRLKVPMKVVSSSIYRDAHAIIVKTLGNLALLLVAQVDARGRDTLDLYLLNLAKMDKADGFLGRHASVKSVLALLRPAMVKRFTKIGVNEWGEITL